MGLRTKEDKNTVEKKFLLSKNLLNKNSKPSGKKERKKENNQYQNKGSPYKSSLNYGEWWLVIL